MEPILFAGQPVPVIFENDELIALDKPVGLASIPERNPKNASLLSVLTEARKRKFYVVHRLDKQVSGVILFAKTPEFHRYLNLQFQHRQVLKTYLAVVHGPVVAGRPHRDPPAAGSARAAWPRIRETGKACLTEYEVLDCRPDSTLLRVRPLTGRKHQIRAHLFGIGHPIIGDPLYGDKLFQRTFPRLMLHALGIEFRLPDGRPVEIRTAAPSGFEPSAARAAG